MEISNKLRADYCELASQYLDSISITSLNDFTCVKEALQNLLNQNADASPSLQERVSDVKELLDSPQLYVEDPRNYQTFKKIIRSQIKRKIKEIKELSEAQKEAQIRDLNQKKEKGLEYKEKVKDMQIIQNVLSEELMLQEISDQWDREEERLLRSATMSEEATASPLTQTILSEAPILAHIIVAYYIESAIMMLNNFNRVSR